MQLEDETIVVFISDHGYQMGEHGHLGKRSNYRTSTNIPMMLRVPGITDKGRNQVVSEIVESIDMYPTVVEAAGFGAVPQCDPAPEGSMVQPDLCTEGRNLLPLYKSKANLGTIDPNWRNEAFTQAQGLSLKCVT